MNPAAALLLILASAASAAGAPATAPAQKLSPQARAVMTHMLYGNSPVLTQIVNPPATDPIGPLADQMQDVVVDLSAVKTDAPVQAEQTEVLRGLNAVIAELEQQTSGSGSGGGNPNPAKPMQRSVIAKGPGGSGPLHDAQAGTRLWGQLPARDRDQILQSQTEGFPAGYESVLAGYFSRLAQGQSPADSGPATQPADK